MRLDAPGGAVGEKNGGGGGDLYEALVGPPEVDRGSDEAQRALRERPSFSIRTRVILSFALCFFLTGGVILWSRWAATDVERKLHFLESAGSYASEIEQARRFEKNFLLYGTNLADARSSVQDARSILEQDGDKVRAVVGKRGYETILAHVDQYRTLLDRLGRAPRPAQAAIEVELRSHGQTMVSTAHSLLARERQLMDEKLVMVKQVPLAFLVVLLALVGYIAHFLNRQILGPLKRLLHHTDRIAGGDLTPILPVRRYRDEFSTFAMAMNHMMHELNRRQELLVRSHKLRAVGTLTAGIAHELNNPLNNITLTAAMLKEDYLSLSDAERIEMVDDLIGQADRAQRIVRNLLDFARESEARTEHLEVEGLLEETVRLAQNQLKMAKVRVAFEVGGHLPTIYGDRQQLHQVFLNLVLNAADAMPDGGVLRIAAGAAEEPGFVAIVVADEGTGIPEHVLDNIFDPFFTTKTRGKGTGLGLSVSLGIVSQHGGHIKVESKVGRGTSVTVLLPVSRIPSSISTGVDGATTESAERCDGLATKTAGAG
jgi:two-component system NtrC family sensor kinase